METDGEKFVRLASAKLFKADGRTPQEYVFGASVPKDDPDWMGPWDCAEYCTWAVYQTMRLIYGCTENTAPPARANAFTGAWKRDVLALGVRVPVEIAAHVPGAMLLRRGATSGHIAISTGTGNETVEARGRAYGVVRAPIKGRAWDFGVLIPNASYPPVPRSFGDPAYAPPFQLRYLSDRPQSGHPIRDLQARLGALGVLDAEPTGTFDIQTETAVVQYQLSQGLTPDGMVGAETADALGIDLAAAERELD
jgi:N-acetylmuramoyl-L-alanine amidase